MLDFFSLLYGNVFYKKRFYKIYKGDRSMALMHKSLLSAVVATGIAHACYAQELVSLKTAKQQFANQPEQMVTVKAALRSYYEPITPDADSAYDLEVKNICNQALEQLQACPVTERSAVVFDIDETLMTDYDYFKSRDFDWLIDDAYEFRLKGESRVIKPMQEFYNSIKNLGHKVILLTARRDLLYDITCKNLAQEGYTYDELFLLPMDLFNQHVSHGQWKHTVRQELSKKYDLIGCVGDSLSDFEGDCCGIKVKLPNYLY